MVVAAGILAGDRTPPARQPSTTSFGREGAYRTGIGLALPEIMVTPAWLLVRLQWAPGDPWVIARDGREWDALAVVMTRLRADPLLDQLGLVMVYPKVGVPYRDIIRAYEVADHAGFDDPELIPPWGSHLAPPVLPRVALRAGVARAAAGHGSSASARFATDAAGAAALAAWLAARSPMPAVPLYPGSLIRLVEVEGDATARASDLDRVERALWEARLVPTPADLRREL